MIAEIYDYNDKLNKKLGSDQPQNLYKNLISQYLDKIYFQDSSVDIFHTIKGKIPTKGWTYKPNDDFKYILVNSADRSATDLAIVILHEIGHALTTKQNLSKANISKNDYLDVNKNLYEHYEKIKAEADIHIPYLH